MRLFKVFLGLLVLTAPTPVLAEKNMPDEIRQPSIIIIARLGPLQSHDITIQDFVINGENVIPIFPDMAAFREQNAGSKFIDQAVEIHLPLLIGLLHGNEILILNPGGPHPRRLTVDDLRAMANGAH